MYQHYRFSSESHTERTFFTLFNIHFTSLQTHLLRYMCYIAVWMVYFKSNIIWIMKQKYSLFLYFVVVVWLIFFLVLFIKIKFNAEEGGFFFLQNVLLLLLLYNHEIGYVLETKKCCYLFCNFHLEVNLWKEKKNICLLFDGLFVLSFFFLVIKLLWMCTHALIIIFIINIK